MTHGDRFDPWEQLRQSASIPDDRVRGRSELLTPAARRRLLGATAVVLGSIRDLVGVAEAIVRERIDREEHPGDDPSTSAFVDGLHDDRQANRADGDEPTQVADGAPDGFRRITVERSTRDEPES